MIATTLQLPFVGGQQKSFYLFNNGLGHATRQRIEAQHANEAQSDQNRAQHAITWCECDDTWQCHGISRKNIQCQRLVQATTRVARGATPEIWASLVDNHLRERTKALFAPQSGPVKQLASPVYISRECKLVESIALSRSRVRLSGQWTE